MGADPQQREELHREERSMTIHTAEELADAADAELKAIAAAKTELRYVMGAHAALGWVATTGGQP